MQAEGAVEIVHGVGASGLVLSCEHASNRLPPPWRWPAEDDWLVASHWAWDPGAADITRSLASRLGIPAVLASFSRLLVDPNRRADHPTLFRKEADRDRNEPGLLPQAGWPRAWTGIISVSVNRQRMERLSLDRWALMQFGYVDGEPPPG